MGRHKDYLAPIGLIKRTGTSYWYVRVNGKYFSTGTDNLDEAYEIMLIQQKIVMALDSKKSEIVQDSANSASANRENVADGGT